MIYVGIDVAKDKHDCYIKNAEGQVLAEVFTIANNQEGFDLLFQRIKSAAQDLSKVKVGLEATGHYSYNILGFLLGKGLSTLVLNPLHTNLFRKSLSLRKTKTDKVDARTIVAMMMSDYKARKDGCLTQAKFAEKLMMDTCSYACLEHGESLYCTLTFILHLVFFCKDIDGLVRDLRQVLLDASDDDRFAA